MKKLILNLTTISTIIRNVPDWTLMISYADDNDNDHGDEHGSCHGRRGRRGHHGDGEDYDEEVYLT